MNKSLFFAVLVAVLILGCTSAQGPVGPGLTIRDFKFSPESLSGNQKTSLTLVVQNTGSMDVKNAYAKVYGFGEESQLWTVGEGSTKDNKFSLRAQSSFAGNVGEEKKFVWLMSNNDNIPKDAIRPYTANARVCYPYSTTALGKVEIMSENEWMSRNPIQHDIAVSQTGAPVRITVTSQQPIMKTDKVTLDLLIENTGGGTVAGPGYCRYNFGGNNIVFPNKSKISESEFRAFAEAYFSVNWAGTPKYTFIAQIHNLTGKNNKNENNEIPLDISGTTDAIAKLKVDAKEVQKYNFSVKGVVIYDNNAASRLNRLKLTVSGISDKDCEASVKDTVFLEQGRREKVTVDCPIGSAISQPISSADVQIKMDYDYYVDAKANVMVKGPNRGYPTFEACGGMAYRQSFCNLKTNDDDPCYVECSTQMKGKLVYYKQKEGSAIETSIEVENPSKKVFIDGIELKTLGKEKTFVAYQTCGGTMSKVYLSVDPDNCATGGKRTYNLDLG